eukprot:scaffold9301_cov30-Tisochrysis_lutea.AAC.5
MYPYLTATCGLSASSASLAISIALASMRPRRGVLSGGAVDAELGWSRGVGAVVVGAEPPNKEEEDVAVRPRCGWPMRGDPRRSESGEHRGGCRPPRGERSSAAAVASALGSRRVGGMGRLEPSKDVVGEKLLTLRRSWLKILWPRAPRPDLRRHTQNHDWVESNTERAMHACCSL